MTFCGPDGIAPQVADDTRIAPEAKVIECTVIEAGAPLSGGKQVPGGRLATGAPGREVRSLDAGALAGWRASAAHYQDRMRRFRACLTAV